MIESEVLYIAIGLVMSLLFTEVFGLAPGGIIVPGYVALQIHDPVVVSLTFGVSLATFLVVRALSNVAIIYGRRRTALMILLGFVGGFFVRSTLGVGTLVGPFEVNVVGYIVPGLIAIWMDRQGMLGTLSMALAAAASTRLAGILLIGD